MPDGTTDRNGRSALGHEKPSSRAATSPYESHEREAVLLGRLFARLQRHPRDSARRPIAARVRVYHETDVPEVS